MLWLLEASIWLILENARNSGFVPTAEQQTEFLAYHADSETGQDSRILTIAGSSAEISVKGVLTATPDWFAMFFGGGNVTYSEINAALAMAERDDTVKDITLSIDSPGGHINGLFETLAAIEATSKPITAMVHNQAASAAYAIAAKADTIVAKNKATSFGSVGVVARAAVDESYIDIASTKAPKKRPDVTTAEGQAVVREGLDPIHNLFAESIAEGRDTTIAKVNAEFGQGSMLVAEEALKRGMIDSVAESPLKSVKNAKSNTAQGGNQPEAGLMDLNELRAQHPDIYQAAVQQGVEQERDRVSAHLTMGAASGDLETAHTAITDGAEMTATLSAKYMAAGMNRGDVSDRQIDDDDAGAALDGAANNPEGGDKGSVVADILEAKLGIVQKG